MADRLSADIGGVGFKALLASDLTDPHFPVPGFIAEGLTLFGGRPKVGKTWAWLNIATSAAIGEPVLGRFACRPLSVIYFDLENGPRMIKSRLASLFPSPEQAPDLLDNITLIHDLNPLNRGGLDEIEDMLAARRGAGSPVDLVVIDTLKPILSGKARGQVGEHHELNPLHALAIAYSVAIVGIEHLTKRRGWKELSEAFGGTHGQTGAVGDFMVLDDRSGSIVLRSDGRLTPKRDLLLERIDGRMVAAGEADEVITAESEKAVLAYLDEVEGARTSPEIEVGTGLTYDTAKKATYRLRDRGFIVVHGRGQFSAKGTGSGHAAKSRPVVPSVPLSLSEDKSDDISIDNEKDDIIHHPPEILNNTTKGRKGQRDGNSKRDKKAKEAAGPKFEEDEFYFLNWFCGYGDEATHREAQQRCSPRLTGDDIRRVTGPLSDRGFLTITEVNEEGEPLRYQLTAAGREAIRGPSLF
jgi:hypothetical protein